MGVIIVEDAKFTKGFNIAMIISVPLWISFFGWLKIIVSLIENYF